MAENSGTHDGIYTLHNHIYFYSEITDETIAALLKELHTLENDMRWQQIRLGLDTPPGITLHIRCDGGYVNPAFGAADHFMLCKVPITSVVEGSAASGGTILSMACAHRLILPNASMMIHQMSDVTWGTHEQILDRVEWNKKTMKLLVDFYAAHSNMTRKDIRAALKHDTSFTAKEALVAGLVDGIAGQQVKGREG